MLSAHLDEAGYGLCEAACREARCAAKGLSLNGWESKEARAGAGGEAGEWGEEGKR